jgi:uncharacterized protein (TIGR03382 family)
MFLALAGSRTAFAGGTGTSTGAESQGDSETDGSSGADSSSETTEGACETCPPSTSTGAIDFGDLEHGNPPAGERVIELSASTKCSCSECACFDDTPTQLRLALDGDDVGDPCPSAQCEFTIMLTPGEHLLTATATYASGEVSAEAPLVVPGEVGTTETGTPMQDEESTGCGCTSSRAASPLGMLVVLAVRRRRRSPGG